MLAMFTAPREGRADRVPSSALASAYSHALITGLPPYCAGRWQPLTTTSTALAAVAVAAEVEAAREIATRRLRFWWGYAY